MIFGARYQQAFCWMPVQGSNLPLMSRKHRLFYTTGKVKNLYCSVVTSRREFAVRWGKYQSSDCFVVSLNLLDIVKIRLPVFNDAVLIGGYQPIFAVRVARCSDSRLMSLLPCQSLFRLFPTTFLACIISSKLNDIPFHSVNSPLDDAVSSLLPSGVHMTTLIGYLALFKDECRCLAGIESAALCGRARGGVIWKHQL